MTDDTDTTTTEAGRAAGTITRFPGTRLPSTGRSEGRRPASLSGGRGDEERATGATSSAGEGSPHELRVVPPARPASPPNTPSAKGEAPDRKPVSFDELRRSHARIHDRAVAGLAQWGGLEALVAARATIEREIAAITLVEGGRDGPPAPVAEIVGALRTHPDCFGPDGKWSGYAAETFLVDALLDVMEARLEAGGTAADYVTRAHEVGTMIQRHAGRRAFGGGE